MYLGLKLGGGGGGGLIAEHHKPSFRYKYDGHSWSALFVLGVYRQIYLNQTMQS